MTANARRSESRGERRKRETRERLLEAALRVFLERGFDAATTAEMAAAADVGAGTFYLHFRDKRDVYEAIARHAAREMIGRWREKLRPGLGSGEYVALGLETVAEFWEADRGRARLLLQGGPTFNAEAHLRLAEDLAEIIRREFPRAARGRTPPSPTVMATVILGLALEIGRMIVGDDSRKARQTIEGTIEFARRAFGPATLPRLRPSR
jgi:AcrR family transcriptional regulator